MSTVCNLRPGVFIIVGRNWTSYNGLPHGAVFWHAYDRMVAPMSLSLVTWWRSWSGSVHRRPVRICEVILPGVLWGQSFWTYRSFMVAQSCSVFLPDDDWCVAEQYRFLIWSSIIVVTYPLPLTTSPRERRFNLEVFIYGTVLHCAARVNSDLLYRVQSGAASDLAVGSSMVS